MPDSSGRLTALTANPTHSPNLQEVAQSGQSRAQHHTLN